MSPNCNEHLGMELEKRLEEIRHLLSRLHGEVSTLEENYDQVLIAVQGAVQKADVDDLTGLLRRGAFFEKLKKELRSCAETGDVCYLLMIDLDHFKRINDTKGHQAGDEAIRNAAALIRESAPRGSLIGRFGGEEFMIAIRQPRIRDAQTIHQLAERIRSNAEESLPCSLSIGVASSESEGFESALLLRAADRALYRAKEKGRNQVCAA